MKISEQRKNDLYDAIYEPVIQLRIRASREGLDIDKELFDLQNEIWKQVHGVLNIDTPA